MSFMMSWKSPPKALHSFSIPASIFPQARKNPPQLPNKQTFSEPQSRQVLKNVAPTAESMNALLKKIYNGLSVSYKQHPEEGEVHL